MSYANIIFSRFDFLLLQIVLQEAEIMNQGKTVFAQIMSLIPRYEFDMHIPADTRSAFPVISVQSPVSIQCCWQS